MANLIDGKTIAAQVEAEVRREISALAELGIRPSLVAVDVGQDPASERYLRRQEKICSGLGVAYQRLRLDPALSERQIQRELANLNKREDVTGIILQSPLPDHINLRAARRAISPEKDVEGVHPQNLGYLLSGRPTLVPCTAAAALACVQATGLALKGLEAVVVGHSETVGKPVALLLMEQLATVTVCHIGTRDLASHLRSADLIVVAVGRPGLIDGSMVKEGVAVIDVGINEVERDGVQSVVGDVDRASVEPRAGWLTPVPGGVGPVTVAMLLRNTVTAVARQGLLST